MLVRASAMLAFALGVACPLAAQCETDKLTPQPPNFRSFFGSYVALAGDMAAVGEQDAQFRSSAKVFRRIGLDWVQTDHLSFGKASGSFGSTIALSQDTLLIGDMDHEKVGVFHFAGGVWSFVQTLKPTPLVSDAHFGRRIVIDGDRLVVAAPMDATYNYRGGAVLVFERVGGSWIQTAKIEPDSPRSFGFFGLAIALDGDTLVIGEPGNVIGGGSGRVFVYRLIGGNWQNEYRLGTYSGAFGYAVAVEGDRMAVGACKDQSHGGPNIGSVHLYERHGSWVQVGKITVDDPASGHWFGATVALHGDHILTGSASSEIGLGDAAHLHRWEPGWPLEATFLPHDGGSSFWGPMFGAAIAMDDDTILVGSPGDEPDANIEVTGAAYFYTREDLTESYCGPANLNSLGIPGLLDSIGCPTTARNDLRLIASQLPAHRVGMFLFSRERDFVPPFGGNQGNLCLGGVFGRFSDQVGESGPGGELELTVDLTDLPIAGGSHSAGRGETWNFQCWYRDNNPGPTSNLTSAIAVSIR